MNSDNICVKVTYRNKDLNPTYSRVYSIEEYTDMLKTDLLKLITDVENLCYVANDNKPKEEWSDETFSGFCLIKHKLLDKAGDVGRIPENIIYKESLSNFVARIIDKEE